MLPAQKIGIVYIIATIIGVVSVTTGTIALIQERPPQSILPIHSTHATLETHTLATSTQNTTLSFQKKQISQPVQLKHAISQKDTSSTNLHATKKVAVVQNTVTKSSQTVNISTTTTTVREKSDGLLAATFSIRKALVNITCEIKMTGSIAHISGSGVFISQKGYIITNAHVAQYLLLKNYPHVGATTCVVRTGGPAKARYNASIVFLSSDWIYANTSTNLQKTHHRTETGKHDIAILAVSGVTNEVGANNAKAPTSFPFVPLGNIIPTINEPVVIGSYAAQFLSPELLKTELYPTIAYGSIKKLYTFASTTADVVALGGTAAAQEGSSGGGVLNANGKLAAMIVIGTVTGPTNTRNLAAITARYIRRDYASEAGKSLNALLAESTTTATTEFSSTKQKLSTYFKKMLTH